MKSTGILRTVDRMGRIVIPKEIRAQLDIENEKDKLEIYVEDDRIVLKKYTPACTFCNSLTQSVSYEGRTGCKKCIEKLEELKLNMK